MVDWRKIKKEYVPATEVPVGRGTGAPWDEIFGDIQKGQALVLHEPEVSAGTIRAALQRQQKYGKFKNLKVTTKGVHGTAIIYVSNTEKPTQTIKLTPTRTPRAPQQQNEVRIA
jgi:hypothetical protein